MVFINLLNYVILNYYKKRYVTEFTNSTQLQVFYLRRLPQYFKTVAVNTTKPITTLLKDRISN